MRYKYGDSLVQEPTESLAAVPLTTATIASTKSASASASTVAAVATATPSAGWTADATPIGSFINTDGSAIESVCAHMHCQRRRGIQCSKLKSTHRSSILTLKRRGLGYQHRNLLNAVHVGQGSFCLRFFTKADKAEPTRATSITVFDHGLRSSAGPSSSFNVSITASSMAPNSENFVRSVSSSVCHARPLLLLARRGINPAMVPCVPDEKFRHVDSK